MTRKPVALLLAAVVIVIANGTALSIPPPVPLPKVILDSDLIIRCKVLEVSETQRLKLRQPGATAAGRGWFRTIKVQVDKLILDEDKILTDRMGKKKALVMDVITPAPVPRRRRNRPGGIEMMPMGGPMYAKLLTGRDYVLMLRKFPDRSKYFMPAYPRSYCPCLTEPEKIAKIEKLANVGNWPWGKAVGGLRLAVIPSQDEIYMSKMQRGGGARAVDRAFVNVIIALGNVTDKPIALSLYPRDKFLSVSYVDRHKESKKCDLYDIHDARLREDGPAFGDKFIKTVKPGGIMFITPFGPGGRGTHLALDAKPGKVVLEAAYENIRDAETADGLRVWKGKVQSAKLKVRVNRSGKRRSRSRDRKLQRPKDRTENTQDVLRKARQKLRRL